VLCVRVVLCPTVGDGGCNAWKCYNRTHKIEDADHLYLLNMHESVFLSPKKNGMFVCSHCLSDLKIRNS
jgi:hypothetical protein